VVFLILLSTLFRLRFAYLYLAYLSFFIIFNVCAYYALVNNVGAQAIAEEQLMESQLKAIATERRPGSVWGSQRWSAMTSGSGVASRILLIKSRINLYQTTDEFEWIQIFEKDE
jgi:hypothetical protein